MGDYGIKVTKAGEDVSSPTPEDYILNSKYSSVKIQAQYTGTLTIGAGDTEVVSIEHGLSFTPLVIIFAEPSPSSGKWFFCLVYNDSGGDPDSGDCSVDTTWPDDIAGTYVDPDYVKISITNHGGSSKDVKWRAIVFADSGE